MIDELIELIDAKIEYAIESQTPDSEGYLPSCAGYRKRVEEAIAALKLAVEQKSKQRTKKK